MVGCPDTKFIWDWKDTMRATIKLRYGDRISDKKVEKLLDGYLEKRLDNKEVIIINNYTHKAIRTSVLALFNSIENNKVIVGGNACLFTQHANKRNLLIEFIRYIISKRKAAKKEMLQHKKFSPMWAKLNRKQNSFKLIVNSLYGCLGYPGFILYNIFLAEAITNQGKQIITSAINTIEGFLGNKMYYTSINDMMQAIYKLDKEFKDNYKKIKSMLSEDELIGTLQVEKLVDLVTMKFLKGCVFKPSRKMSSHLYEILSNMDNLELLFLYYKNDIISFTKLPIMKEKICRLINYNGELVSSELSAFKDDEARNLMNEIWKYYETFVYYKFSVTDRVRKSMYLNKYKAIYTDTDSVFFSVNEFVNLIKDEIYTEDRIISGNALRFTSANLGVALVNKAIDNTMITLTRAMNTTDEYGTSLAMKNEYFIARILFFDVKKRYVARTMLQEGVVLGDGEGLTSITGLDFIKAGTKETVRNYYTKLLTDKVLTPETIKPSSIYRELVEFRNYIKGEILAGNAAFYKQASVKRIEEYKKPHSNQGIVAITLWNTLSPNHQLELPTDVNIVPIRDLTYNKPPKRDGEPINRAISKLPEDKKSILAYKEKFPNAFELLRSKLYNNSNPLIKHMTLTSIAIPKNLDYELPEHIRWLIDTDSIIQKTINLILPVTEALGMISQPVSTNDKRMSNIVAM